MPKKLSRTNRNKAIGRTGEWRESYAGLVVVIGLFFLPTRSIVAAENDVYRWARSKVFNSEANEQSVYLISTGKHIHLAILHEGFLQTGMQYQQRASRDDHPVLWDFKGKLNTYAGRQTRPDGEDDWEHERSYSLQFEHEPPALTLQIDGRTFDLEDGRVVLLRREGEPLQIPIKVNGFTQVDAAEQRKLVERQIDSYPYPGTIDVASLFKATNEYAKLHPPSGRVEGEERTFGEGQEAVVEGQPEQTLPASSQAPQRPSQREGETENAGTVIQPFWRWFSDSPEEASQVDAIAPVPGSSDIIALIATDIGKDQNDHRQRHIHYWRFAGDGSIKTRRKMDELPYRETRKGRSPRQDVGNSGVGADGFFFEAQHLNNAGRTAIYKYDFTGKKLWSVDCKSSSFIHIHRTLPLSGGGCIVLGEHASNAAITRVSGDGRIVWSRRYEREQRQIFFQGIVDESAGRMAVSGVTGEFNKFGVGEMQVWLAEIDLASGELLSETSFPGRTAAIAKLGSDWVVAYDRNTKGIKADLAITRLSPDFQDQWTTAIDDESLMSRENRLLVTEDKRIIYVVNGSGRLRFIELDDSGNLLRNSKTTSLRPYACRQLELAGDRVIVGLDDFEDGRWTAGMIVFSIADVLKPNAQ